MHSSEKRRNNKHKKVVPFLNDDEERLQKMREEEEKYFLEEELCRAKKQREQMQEKKEPYYKTHTHTHAVLKRYHTSITHGRKVEDVVRTVLYVFFPLDFGSGACLGEEKKKNEIE